MLLGSLGLASGLSGLVAVFLEVGGFAAGAGQGADEAGKGLGVAAEALVEVAGLEMAQGEEETGDGELEGGLVEAGGVEIVEEVEGGFLVVAEVFEPILFHEPALVMGAGGPAGDIARGDVFGFVAEPGGDVLAGDAVAEHGIVLVAGGFGEAADFTAGAMDEWWRGGGGRWWLGLWRRRGFGGASGIREGDLHSVSGKMLPSGGGLLPTRPPLRTVLESFPSFRLKPLQPVRLSWARGGNRATSGLPSSYAGVMEAAAAVRPPQRMRQRKQRRFSKYSV